MPLSRPGTAALDGSSYDLEVAFYEALQLGDIEQLMSCREDDDEIVCVHPGGPRLMGAQAIRTAFETVLSHGTVRARPLQLRRVVALTSAVHSVVEQVDVMLPRGLYQAVVLTTPVYHRTSQRWRMVAHHASPGSASAADAHEQPQPVLH